MKITLHIGMPKAGSTALQKGLAALHQPLLDAGVLYPASPVIKEKQALLISGLLPPQRLPRLLRQKYQGDAARLDQDSQAWLEQLSESARATGATTLLLSDEALFLVRDEASFTMLAERLRSLADTVEAVVYVRRPSDFYLSMAQQTLKASHAIRPVRPVSYRAVLDGYAKSVADTLHVIPYDRTPWPDGDILRHFLDTFVPGTNVSTEGAPGRPNTSLSAEAMSLLATYRGMFWPESNSRFTPDTRRLIRALNAADSELGGSRRPRLHESVRRFVDNASTDLLWLRDMHGIVFDDIDYDAVGKPSDASPKTDSVEDICRVDAERKDELALHVLRQLAEPPSTAK